MTTIIAPREHDLGDGFRVRRAVPTLQARSVGPFVFVDHMGPVVFEAGRGLDVRPHPHIGLATVTFLWDGAIRHRDTLGADQVIRPGDVNWMTAGRGIAHSERTPAAERAAGSLAHGMQTWVALPRAHEETDPAFHHHPAASLPQQHRDGAWLRVIAGRAYGEESPVQVFADTLNAWMEPVLPRFVAEALSMTIAAQVFTLPIQVLIEPELPVFSIPANLMVAPFVGFATLAGLASLAVSWLIPWLGLQLARAASWGTAVMELTALELGSGSQATIPWAGGVGGAVLVCVVEAACAAAAIMTHRLFGRMMVQEPDLPGKRLIANPVERLRMWMERTRKALRELQWEE